MRTRPSLSLSLSVFFAIPSSFFCLLLSCACAVSLLVLLELVAIKLALRSPLLRSPSAADRLSPPRFAVAAPHFLCPLGPICLDFVVLAAWLPLPLSVAILRFFRLSFHHRHNQCINTFKQTTSGSDCLQSTCARKLAGLRIDRKLTEVTDGARCPTERRFNGPTAAALSVLNSNSRLTNSAEKIEQLLQH